MNNFGSTLCYIFRLKANRSIGEVFKGVYYIWAWPPSRLCDQAQFYNIIFHYSKKRSHDVKIIQQFLRKTKSKYENEMTFVEGQIMTLTSDIYIASFNHFVQCCYQLCDHKLQ